MEDSERMMYLTRVIVDDLNRLLQRTIQYLEISDSEARLKLISMLTDQRAVPKVVALAKREPMTRSEMLEVQDQLDSDYEKEMFSHRSLQYPLKTKNILQQVMEELATGELHSTTDSEKVIAVKKLTLSSSLVYRFGINEPKKAKTQKENEELMLRMENAGEYFAGNRSPSDSEYACLKHINAELGADENPLFLLNSTTFYRGDLSCTPDAIMRDKSNNVVAVAEFKSISEGSPHNVQGKSLMNKSSTIITSSDKKSSALRQQTAIASHQVQIAMVVLKCDTAYTVIYQNGVLPKTTKIDRNPEYLSKLKHAISRMNDIRALFLKQPSSQKK
jgi:hypothetical protein